MYEESPVEKERVSRDRGAEQQGVTFNMWDPDAPPEEQPPVR